MDQLGTSRRPQLDSWKEIAAYLRRDVRTVQLWEKKEALPVHRHAHTARATVYAFPDELDAWLVERKHSGSQAMEEPVPAGDFPERKKRRQIFYFVLLASLLVTLAASVFVINHYRNVARPSPTTPSPSGTIAVLPFEDLSARHRDDHLADGLTDDIIVFLGQTGKVPVISRRSSSRFKSTHEPLPQIAQSLHANFVVEGSLARAGGRVRITADLVDATSDRHLWSQSYERSLTDVLSMQDEVAASIAASVTEKITGKAAGISPNPRPVDPEARAAYLTGRFFWNKRDEPGLKKAIEYFNQAIAKDPRYAAPYSGLADCYTLLSVWGSLSSRESFPKAKRAALTAVKLDPRSAEAYNSLAVVTARWDWNFSAAELYFQKAIEINPNYAVAHQWYGEFLGDLGRREQSIAESEKAVELDPLSPMAGCDLAVTYMHARQAGKAVNALQRVLTFAPDFEPAHLYLGAAYEGLGQLDKAEAEYRREAATVDNTRLVMLKIGRDVAAGRTQQAKKEAEELVGHSPEGRFAAYNLAGLYFGIGEKEAGYRELERAYREHSWLLVNLPVEASFDSVRNEPRFRDLVRRVGLPEE